MTTATSVAGEHVHTLRQAYVQWEILKLRSHPRHAAIADAFQTRLLLESKWEAQLTAVSNAFFTVLRTEAAIEYALANWKPVTASRWRVRKDHRQPPPIPPDEEEIRRLLTAGINEDAMLHGAVQTYIGMALQTGEQAGQYALNHLGMNRSFAWAHPRSMGHDLFSVRGSKVIQNMYGDHVNALTRIITAATNPAQPKTMQEVQSLIKEQWPDLQRSQVARIARTETATAWTTTSVNAYAANGISAVESLVAQGPSIGVESEDPCDECVDAAAQGAFDIADDMPPWHPNCRCEVVPVLEDPESGDQWLPPQEPWTGGTNEDLVAAPAPGQPFDHSGQSVYTPPTAKGRVSFDPTLWSG